MIFHLILSVVAIGFGIYFKIDRIEWMILMLSITLVFVTEIINTSIEFTIDLYTRDKKMFAMLSKDIAAGAVLVSAINALIMGYLIFYERFATLIQKGL